MVYAYELETNNKSHNGEHTVSKTQELTPSTLTSQKCDKKYVNILFDIKGVVKWELFPEFVNADFYCDVLMNGYVMYDFMM